MPCRQSVSPYSHRSSKRAPKQLFCLLLACYFLLPLSGCKWLRRAEWVVQDAHGRAAEAIEIGQTLVVGLSRLPKNTSVRITLRESGKSEVVSFYQLTTDANGGISPAVLWYHSGVLDERTLKARKKFPYEFARFEEADQALAGKKLVLRAESLEGKVLAEHALPIVGLGRGANPLIYFSTKEGALRNSFVINQDQEMFLTVRNLKGADRVQVLLVPNQYGWREKLPLQEVRSEYQERPQIVELRGGQEATTISLGSPRGLALGGYDVILRPNVDRLDRFLLPDDIVTYGIDTGILLQLVYDPPWAPNDFDIAGRPDKSWGYPYFEFHDVFELGEKMWGAVDPAILPSTHVNGRYAGFYVISHGSASSGLADLTGTVEVVPVRSGCINANITDIWSSANQEGEYDIVVDFGSTTAMALGDYQPDNTFNVGVDFIDRSTKVGAYVVRDPALPGSFSTNAHSYQPATTSPTDPLRTDVSAYFNAPASAVTETMDKVPLRGVGYYPSGAGPFPLMLIVHGNHTPTHTSHTGYDYLCQLLASHGIIAISIDQNFLNGPVSGEMDARAIVILRHLQRWREWNNTLGHTFYNKVDLSSIGLAGHSRGGEAITVANHFNTLLHNASDPNHNFNFNIKSLYAIAPVDGQIGTGYTGTPIVINNADYFIMHGSHDGDVFTIGGQKTYDRAFPNVSLAGGSKGLLFVQGANHNYWNTEWASHANDGAAVISPLAQIGATPQQNIGRVYISAFFQLTLLNKEAYVALLTGDVSFGSLPTGVTLVHQYSDESRVDLNNYQEDTTASTGSFSGVTNGQNGLNPFLDTDITGSWNWSNGTLSNSFSTWNETRGLVAGWNTLTATYEINLPAPISTYVFTHPYLSLRIGQVYESSPSLNPVGANKDLSIELQLGSVPAHSLKVSNFDTLPYPVQSSMDFSLWGLPYGVRDTSKSMMKTVRIPLRSFVVNRADWDLTQISKITLRFNQSPTGRIVIDDIQLTK